MLEILLVVAAIAILAGIVVSAINPGKQLAETRNAKRMSNVNTIINGVFQYSIDQDGAFPPGISPGVCAEAQNEICKTGATDCTGLVDLSELTLDGEYLVNIPVDPNGASENGTGYHVVGDSGSRFTVCAPHAERGVVMEVHK